MRNGEVRFALMNGHRQFEPSGPKSATFGHVASNLQAICTGAWLVSSVPDPHAHGLKSGMLRCLTEQVKMKRQQRLVVKAEAGKS